jgi:RNA polymerase sigma-70 factor (ECF subfamily)
MFVLNRLDGMKYAEIASLYGVSVSAVEKHIIKCLAHLGRASAARWK